MATIQPVAPFASRRHHPATMALLVLLFWMVAAVLVLAAHAAIEPLSARAGAIATVALLVLTAFGYTHLVARDAGVSHALGVGIAWLVLAIAAEMASTAAAGHSWFTLLGSPDRPLLRQILLFAWIFSPSLFARREAAS